MRTRCALEPAINLVLQQLGSLIEQIHRHQAVGESPDYLVAAGAYRRQLAKVVEQCKRVDGRKAVTFAGEKQRLEGGRRFVLDTPGQVGIGRAAMALRMT